MASSRKRAKPPPDNDAKAKSPEPPAPPPKPGLLTTRGLVLGALAVFVLHAFVCMWIRNLGFDHISDDDFSRVTIAQVFAHKASLDPSGTSWLPFPFWILGLGMKVIGRSLDDARGLSIFFASAAAPLPWIALRLSGIPRGRAFIGALFALGTPWAIWSGAATVPESFTASLTVAAVIGLAAAVKEARLDTTIPASSGAEPMPLITPRATIAFGAAMLAACLSRYEPWPIAAVLAISLGTAGWKTRKRALFIAAALCILGPLLWMAWNAHAHDGPLHFFRRVTIYKRALGDGSSGTLDALLLYPKLLLAVRPEVLIPALVLSPLAIADKDVRKRWGLPLLSVLALVVFLSIGNARDGAPSHHAERALLAAYMLLALYVTDIVLTPWIRKSDLTSEAKLVSPRAQKTFAAFITVAWLITVVRAADLTPGANPSEDRSEQIQRGDKLHREGAKSLLVTPCSYEHFALIASFGEPENVDVNPSYYGHDCPHVEVR